ncbi:MAG TPA: EF-hand domain-containing protein [Bacteroidaceae bacterium]|nr:EF-hand domain-containing protein [Bacteroidaceae bacterium]
MVGFCLKRICIFIILLTPAFVYGQDEVYDDILRRIDTVENPVYKPVMAFSYGVLNFRGDVQNSYLSPVIGNPALRINFATFIDNLQYFTGNFNFLLGKLNGNQYSHNQPENNLNFQTDIFSFGINMEYRFGHLVNKKFPVRPYLSLGIENINYSAKGDLLDREGRPYYYWPDGTIRDRDENAPGTPQFLFRDYNYETDLRKREKEEFGLGNYKQNSLAIPVEAGLYFRINERISLNLGVSYHQVFSDYIDNVAYTGTSIKGAKGNDGFIFSHFGIHFDLFSDPTTRTVDLLYADVEFDPLFYDDEDGDFVLDPADRCPGTPFGVVVDAHGCPVDSDGDGVPDYLDEEPDTGPGAWVDERGVTITEDDFYTSIMVRENAMDREDVKTYMSLIESIYVSPGSTDIPGRFKPLDTDNDGELSFEELLKAIDAFFDFSLDITIDELREVNEFFFSQ